ncbi:hypothetical protein AB0G35_27980 [Streptomyces sp. NPDC021749]|uniref:hypothetical protein n=1 Tax=Streptomyces sp. NPDC021749 TaxID=3154905 RepID=UPI0033D6B831
MTQPMPYRVAAPRVTPAARRSQQAPQLPVFIGKSGWRRRTLQGLALALGCACLGYLLFVGTLISGLRQSVGTHPPSMNGPVPSGPGTGTSQHGHGAPARAEAHQPPARARANGDARRRPQAGARANGDARRRPQAGARANGDARRRPPAGRSAPSAGGPER